jgi:hypothetical protein
MLHLLRIKKQVAIVSPLTKSIDTKLASLTKRFFFARLRKLESTLSGGYRFIEVDQIREYPTPQSSSPEIELHRGVDVVNWMLKYPWVVESGKSGTEKMDYFFSDSRPMFRQIAVEVYSRMDEYLGFAVFSISQKGEKIALKSLDFSFIMPSDYRAVMALALRYAREYNVDTIELPSEIAAYLDVWLGKLLLLRKERIYQCMPKSDHSPLARLWPEIELRLIDGDMAFS